MPKKVRASPPPAPAAPKETRHCCMLTPLKLDILGGVGIADPANLGFHMYGTNADVYGAIYTCAAGFIDLGHVRDQIDLTYYYHHLISKGGKNKPSTSFETVKHEGKVTIKKLIPKNDQVAVARSIAYDQSVFHEIETYWFDRPGYHNSAFSPEDLTSNFLGTVVAGRAIEARGVFDVQVTQKLNALLTSISARTPAQTADAFNKVKNVYFDGNILGGVTRKRYLLRRNFKYLQIEPCLVPGVTGCTAVPFPPDIPRSFPPEIGLYYDVEFKVAIEVRARMAVLVVKKGDFAVEINKIKVAAAKPPADGGYGPGFESCAVP